MEATLGVEAVKTLLSWISGPAPVIRVKDDILSSSSTAEGELEFRIVNFDFSPVKDIEIQYEFINGNLRTLAAAVLS